MRKSMSSVRENFLKFPFQSLIIAPVHIKRCCIFLFSDSSENNVHMKDAGTECWFDGMHIVLSISIISRLVQYAMVVNLLLNSMILSY